MNSDSERQKVHFIHGLESSPQSRKARVLAEHFDALTPAMDTADFEGCVGLQARAIAARPPAVVIGSSFGGAVLAALAPRGLWDGPCLFLCQAAVVRGLPLALPTTAPVRIIHGLDDDVVAPADSRRLAEANPRSNVQLSMVEDDHALHTSTSNGQLIAWVRDLLPPS
jgi:pimeloyl-ACP methyl ester carboxylesterase